MALKSRDKHFRLPKISLIDFKTIEMDRVLTGLFARIYHRGQDSRLYKKDTTIETFEEHFLANPDRFKDFSKHKDIARGWLETHLLDLVNRGKTNQAVAAPRPLHGYTYRFRNPKHCRDYGAAQQLYETLWHARNDLGKRALERLKSFFFEGIDPNTQQEDFSVMVDVETQALLSLNQSEVMQDAPVKDSRVPTPPLCVGSAELLADDIVRLLQYRPKIPRSVMVDYLKILLAFHLALYHLRLFKLLPRLVAKKGAEPVCLVNRCPMKPGREDGNPHGDCPYQIGLFVDVQNLPGTRISQLAEISADVHYRRIPSFVRAYFLTKKLDEFALHLLQFGKLLGGPNKQLSVSEVLGLLDDSHTNEREQYFGARILSLTEDLRVEDDVLDPEIEMTMAQGLDKLNTYIECLMALRGDFQRSFIVKALDSLLLKNRSGGLISQARSAKAPRRFILDSRLLEVLLQIAVLRYDTNTGNYRSEEIQIDRLLTFLRERYGLYIDGLPRGEGFGEPSIEDREALRRNKEAFKNKLREIGFFQDLSDAYVTQHVTPRHRIGERPAVPSGGAA